MFACFVCTVRLRFSSDEMATTLLTNEYTPILLLLRKKHDVGFLIKTIARHCTEDKGCIKRIHGFWNLRRFDSIGPRFRRDRDLGL
jgi:hypothetical protein